MNNYLKDGNRHGHDGKIDKLNKSESLEKDTFVLHSQKDVINLNSLLQMCLDFFKKSLDLSSAAYGSAVSFNHGSAAYGTIKILC